MYLILPQVGHFLSQNFDTFTRTSVFVSKMNAVARAQLAFQMSTLIFKKIYIYNDIVCLGVYDLNVNFFLVQCLIRLSTSI